LAATGYVVAAAASLADFIGIGSHTIRALVFGKIQVAGLTIGVLFMVAGVVLYWPRIRRSSPDSVASTAPAPAPAGQVR
jgi:hypothetical protein